MELQGLKRKIISLEVKDTTKAKGVCLIDNLLFAHAEATAMLS